MIFGSLTRVEDFRDPVSPVNIAHYSEDHISSEEGNMRDKCRRWDCQGKEAIDGRFGADCDRNTLSYDFLTEEDSIQKTAT